MPDETYFARLVSLACHDLRTPLATVHGFARTLARDDSLEPPADRYVEMIDAASGQLGELIDELSLAARIESGRYDPTPREANTLELARAAAARLGEDRVRVAGSGAALETDGGDRVPRVVSQDRVHGRRPDLRRRRLGGRRDAEVVRQGVGSDTRRVSVVGSATRRAGGERVGPGDSG